MYAVLILISLKPGLRCTYLCMFIGPLINQPAARKDDEHRGPPLG